MSAASAQRPLGVRSANGVRSRRSGKVGREPKRDGMARPLTSDAVAKICEHMNDDHADAVARYAEVFGRCTNVEAARLRGFDADGMDLDVVTGGETRATRIAFDHALADADDARETFIAMARASAAP